jgi:hypothetical protein
VTLFCLLLVESNGSCGPNITRCSANHDLRDVERDWLQFDIPAQRRTVIARGSM